MYHLHFQGLKSAEQETSAYQVAGNLLQAGFLIGWFSSMKMEMIYSSETSFHIWTTRRYIPEDGSVHLLNKAWKTQIIDCIFETNYENYDLLSGPVVRVPGYRSRGPGSIPGATRFSKK
jgi:hypothetical protein